MYKEGWAREDHPYWLDNVLVRYDSLASEVQAKIVVVQAAQRQYWIPRLCRLRSVGIFLE